MDGNTGMVLNVIVKTSFILCGSWNFCVCVCVCVTGHQSLECVWIMSWWSSNLLQWPIRNLGSIANLSIYIPVPPFQLFSLSPSMSQLPYHPLPFDWSASIFAPNYSPSSGLGPHVHLDNLPLLPASTARTCTCCLATLDLIPRSLLALSSPCRELVSAASSPLWSPPFLCPRRC